MDTGRAYVSVIRCLVAWLCVCVCVCVCVCFVCVCVFCVCSTPQHRTSATSGGECGHYWHVGTLPPFLSMYYLFCSKREIKKAIEDGMDAEAAVASYPPEIFRT